MDAPGEVLVTGASRGIGLALVRAARAEGAPVIGTHRGSAPAVPGVDWQMLDVADPRSQADLAMRLSGRRIGLLVCNAGVYLDRGASLARGYDAALWADTFAANVTGVFLTVQALLPHLADAGKIAIISSQMASTTRAPGGSYAYRASKAAVLNFGRNLAADLRPGGIAVGIYHPGWVRTDMGGAGADISMQEAAAGLLARFAQLSPATTGCFEAWDGQALPY